MKYASGFAVYFCDIISPWRIPVICFRAPVLLRSSWRINKKTNNKHNKQSTMCIILGTYLWHICDLHGYFTRQGLATCWAPIYYPQTMLKLLFGPPGSNRLHIYHDWISFVVWKMCLESLLQCNVVSHWLDASTKLIPAIHKIDPCSISKLGHTDTISHCVKPLDEKLGLW